MPFIHANDITLYHEWHGPEDAPVLVLNNGILMSTASWAMQTPVFAQQYRVLLYDLRGQWQSDHPRTPYSMAGHAADLGALLDALRIDRAHLLGISYGGEVVQAFALRYPSRAASLVLANTVSEVHPPLRTVIDAWRDAARTGDSERLFHVTRAWSFSPAFVASHPAIVESARQRYRTLDMDAFARMCEAVLDVDFTARLPEVSVPTCVIASDLDRLKGPEYARVLHASIGGSELHVIGGAGHAACWEQPDDFNRVVLDFLGRITKPERA